MTCVRGGVRGGKRGYGSEKNTYFSHSGRIQRDEYLENNVPYSIAQIRKLTEERSRSADNRGRGEVNKVYPSKEAYLYTLYGGNLRSGRTRSYDHDGKKRHCSENDEWNRSVYKRLYVSENERRYGGDDQ